MQKLYPKFSQVALDKLEYNKDFLAQAYTYQSGLTFLVENIDRDDVTSSQVAKVVSSSSFLSSPSIAHQMDVSLFPASLHAGCLGLQLITSVVLGALYCTLTDTPVRLYRTESQLGADASDESRTGSDLQ